MYVVCWSIAGVLGLGVVIVCLLFCWGCLGSGSVSLVGVFLRVRAWM